MSWGILGGGFGLYGYLPALAERGNDEQIVTLEKYRDTIRSRSDISTYEGRITFLQNKGDLISLCDHLIIAKRPADQVALVSLILTTGWNGSLLLEKPLACTPRQSTSMVERLQWANIGFCVGYTLAETEWAGEIRNIFSGDSPDYIKISWRFLAHHYKYDLSNWKRFTNEGGGALRFYCNHLIAFLSDLREWAVDRISPSSVAGEDPGFQLELNGGGCIAQVECDSDWKDVPVFEILVKKGDKVLFMCSEGNPFEPSKEHSFQDARIGYLQKIIKRIDSKDFLSSATCQKQINLWERIEEGRNSRHPREGDKRGRHDFQS